jgi:HEAT repeat protein
MRGDDAAHMALFVETEAPEPQATLEINSTKVERILADYERRLESAPVHRKPAVVGEIAALPQKRATQYLLVRIADPDVGVRRAAIEALGRRGDPDAVKPLLKAFKETRRELPVFASVADALARLGHEDAVAPMLEVLEGKEIHAAAIVAAKVPTLLLQQRKDDVLAGGVSRMIDALEKVHDRLKAVPHTPLDAEAGYHVSLLGALRATVGQAFSEPVDFRRWWNENRRRFLEERARQQ